MKQRRSYWPEHKGSLQTHKNLVLLSLEQHEAFKSFKALTDIIRLVFRKDAQAAVWKVHWSNKYLLAELTN